MKCTQPNSYKKSTGKQKSKVIAHWSHATAATNSVNENNRAAFLASLPARGRQWAKAYSNRALKMMVNSAVDNGIGIDEYFKQRGAGNRYCFSCRTWKDDRENFRMRSSPNCRECAAKKDKARRGGQKIDAAPAAESTSAATAVPLSSWNPPPSTGRKVVYNSQLHNTPVVVKHGIRYNVSEPEYAEAVKGNR